MKLTKKNIVALGSAAVMVFSLSAFALAAEHDKIPGAQTAEKATFNGDAADMNVLFADEQAEGTAVTASAQATEKASFNGDAADMNVLFADDQAEGTAVTAGAN